MSVAADVSVSMATATAV